jgi:hypothetical protein
MRRLQTILLPIALSLVLSLPGCSASPAAVTDADVDEFRQVAEDYQQLYMDGGENCDQIIPVLAEDIRMMENGETWSHEQMEKYCPYLPRKEVLSSWSDLDVVTPRVAYDFVTSVYRVGENPPGRETVARAWRRIGTEWKIVRMSSVRGPVAEPAADGQDAGTPESAGG